MKKLLLLNTMKKLLLILLCVPLMFSCGEKDKEESNKEDKIIELEKIEKESDSINVEVLDVSGISVYLNVRYNYTEKNISSVAIKLITDSIKSILNPKGLYPNQNALSMHDTVIKEGIIQLIKEINSNNSQLHNIEVQLICPTTQGALIDQFNQRKNILNNHLRDQTLSLKKQAYEIEDKKLRKEELLDIEKYFQEQKEQIEKSLSISRKKIDDRNAYYKSPKD